MLAMTIQGAFRWPLVLTIALEVLAWATLIAIEMAIWSAL
jgi:hypothetical protein